MYRHIDICIYVYRGVAKLCLLSLSLCVDVSYLLLFGAKPTRITGVRVRGPDKQTVIDVYYYY